MGRFNKQDVEQSVKLIDLHVFNVKKELFKANPDLDSVKRSLNNIAFQCHLDMAAIDRSKQP